MNQSLANCQAIKGYGFLCGARDFHAYDWYATAKRQFRNSHPVFLITDLIKSEGYDVLTTSDDTVYKLLLLDSFLFRRQSRLGNVWRHFIKTLAFPIQVFKLRRFARKHPNTIYFAHAMYYLWLAHYAGVPFIGTPQGSDVLIKPRTSKLFRLLSKHAVSSALAVTVDSEAMADSMEELLGHRPFIVQNGIDLEAIQSANESFDGKPFARGLVTSFRGVTPLYQTHEIANSVSRLPDEFQQNLRIAAPFADTEYLSHVLRILPLQKDRYLGRLNRAELYQLFKQTLLAISIPTSDSSPRSVYEAIFCGAAVAVTANRYVESLPPCMRSRLVVIDIKNGNWLRDALEQATVITSTPFRPSKAAIDTYSQAEAFKKVLSLPLRKSRSFHN
jgi:hypothetical protein